jgi:hypothetical protein
MRFLISPFLLGACSFLSSLAFPLPNTTACSGEEVLDGCCWAKIQKLSDDFLLKPSPKSLCTFDNLHFSKVISVDDDVAGDIFLINRRKMISTPSSACSRNPRISMLTLDVNGNAMVNLWSGNELVLVLWEGMSAIYIHLQQTLICWSATAVTTAVSYPHSCFTCCFIWEYRIAGNRRQL